MTYPVKPEKLDSFRLDSQQSSKMIYHLHGDTLVKWGTISNEAKTTGVNRMSQADHDRSSGTRACSASPSEGTCGQHVKVCHLHLNKTRNSHIPPWQVWNSGDAPVLELKALDSSPALSFSNGENLRQSLNLSQPNFLCYKMEMIPPHSQGCCED